MYVSEIPDVPHVLQSDNGSEFKGATKKLMEMMGVKIINSQPYHPHVQGKVSVMLTTFLFF